jgi:hypothetical protein
MADSRPYRMTPARGCLVFGSAGSTGRGHGLAGCDAVPRQPGNYRKDFRGIRPACATMAPRNGCRGEQQPAARPIPRRLLTRTREFPLPRATRGFCVQGPDHGRRLSPASIAGDLPDSERRLTSQRGRESGPRLIRTWPRGLRRPQRLDQTRLANPRLSWIGIHESGVRHRPGK